MHTLWVLAGVKYWEGEISKETTEEKYPGMDKKWVFLKETVRASQN